MGQNSSLISNAKTVANNTSSVPVSENNGNNPSASGNNTNNLTNSVDNKNPLLTTETAHQTAQLLAKAMNGNAGGGQGNSLAMAAAMAVVVTVMKIPNLILIPINLPELTVGKIEDMITLLKIQNMKAVEVGEKEVFRMEEIYQMRKINNPFLLVVKLI